MGANQEPTTHDLFAQRRARHSEAEEAALVRRAEAAEAAVQSLESHLAALQQRVQEIGQEREQLNERLSERELEVRNVKQREFAEQQLRVEAEARAQALERRMRSEVQELRKELQDMRERDGRLVPLVREVMGLLGRLRDAFAREIAGLRQELTRQASSEREAYAREMTAMGAQIQSLRIELTGAVAELRTRIDAEAGASAGDAPTEQARVEMADALAAAVERLRARAASLEPGETAAEPQAAHAGTATDEPAAAAEPPAETSDELMAGGAGAPSEGSGQHMPLFARWRAKRRRRRGL